MQLNYNQLSMIHQMAGWRAEGKPDRYIICKARRVGVSSLADGVGVCHCKATVNAKALIVAHLADTADELFDVPLDLVKGLPYTIIPPLKQSITFKHAGGDSELSIATAKTVASGRGISLSFLHLSEVAQFPGTAPFTALLNAVSDKDPNSMIFVESTSFGKVGLGEDFYKMWLAAVAKENDYLPIFLSWLDDPACRRSATEVTDAPIDDDERDIILMVACSARCGRCALCLKALQCVAWRRWAIPNKCQGYVDVFHQEYPVNWEESFVSLKDPAFTNEDLRAASKMVLPPMEEGILLSNRGMFEPPEFQQSQGSPLKIWQHPISNMHYYFGVDAARGQAGGDYASVIGWCGESGEQVCRYANRINPEALAELVNQLGRYYNRGMVNIELTGNLGLWTQTVLRDRFRYPNFYRWKGRDDRLYNGYQPRNSIGWETNRRSRQIMMTAYRSGLHYGRVKVKDNSLLSQMRSAERDEGRWEVIIGHDDILMSALIGWIALEQWHVDTPFNTHKQLELESTISSASTMPDTKIMVPGSVTDAQSAHKAHWDKMQRLMKGGKPKDELQQALSNLQGI